MKKKLFVFVSLFVLLGITLSAFSLNTFASTTNTTETTSDFTYETSNRNIIPNGMYAFKNLGSTNQWMDVQGNQTTPGAHIQQYQFTSSPADVYSASGLFRVNQVGSTGRYIIRLMLDESLTFYFSGTEVLTKKISLVDSEVAIGDTFYITYNNGGYLISPYSSTSYCICSNSTTASGAQGAPSSYLVKSTLASASNKARWIIEGYQTDIKDGIYALQNLGNQERWMDVQQNLTSPGAHLQQYAFGESPASTVSTSGLFRITQIGHTGRYTIRLMLNENLSLGFSGSYVISKTISEKDSDVSEQDTFKIVYNNGGFIIRPCSDLGYVISAQNSTASGATGAPESFLKKRLLANAENQARWTLEGYQTFIDSGVYWLSNDVGISAGSNPRVMDAEGGGYIDETPIQQWKSPSPEAELYGAQTWIVTRLDNGYYTIASSKKPDMYITFSNIDPLKQVVLIQCEDADVINNSTIQWEIRGNGATGYYIINRFYTSLCISVPLTTDNGAELVISYDYSSNNGRNKWTFHRIDDVYLASIYCNGISSGIGSIGFDGSTGHAWIQFENLSTKQVKFGALDVPANEYATVGKWGNQDPKQLWYNLERYYSEDTSGDVGGYISILIRSNQLQKASDYIIANHTDPWAYDDNCTHLANGIWKELTGSKLNYNDIYPSGLLSVMKQKDTYIAGTLLTNTDNYGYVDASGEFKTHTPAKLTTKQNVSQESLLTTEAYKQYIEYMNIPPNDLTYEQYINMIANTPAEETSTSTDTQLSIETREELTTHE